MKKIIILTIAIAAASFTKAQSDIKINMNDVQAQVSTELATLPADLKNMNIDLNNIEIEIDKSMSNLDNMLASINLNNLEYNYNSNSPINSGENFDYSFSATETQQNSDIFNQLSDVKGIQVVYISKAMLGMMPNMNMPGVDVGNIAGKLESLEVYTAEDNGTSKRLISISDKLLNSGNYETLMLTKDSESKTGFYMKTDKSNKGSEMLMITQDDSNATIIRFLGNFTMQDIQNITNKGKGANTSNSLSDAELEKRMKEAEKMNKEAQKIADDAQKKAIEAQKRADAAEKKAREAEEKAKKAN